jgi:transcriptional regulator with XRE-family HTH domain
MAMASQPLDAVTVRVARAIRAHRQTRGMSVKALADTAEISKTILGRIESGLGNPSLETLWRIASALDVPLGALIGTDEPPQTQVIRAGEGSEIVSASGVHSRLILAEGRNHRTEVFQMELPGDEEHRSQPHAPGTEELVICEHGRALVGPEMREVELELNDALWFPADLPHRYRGLEDARLLVIMSYPPAQGVTR